MENPRDNSAVLRVLRRWMPEIRRAAIASGERPYALLERVVDDGLNGPEITARPALLAEAEESGFEEVGSLDRWQARQERELGDRISRRAA
jgi:hypothetical protein